MVLQSSTADAIFGTLAVERFTVDAVFGTLALILSCAKQLLNRGFTGELCIGVDIQVALTDVQVSQRA